MMKKGNLKKITEKKKIKRIKIIKNGAIKYSVISKICTKGSLCVYIYIYIYR